MFSALTDLASHHARRVPIAAGPGLPAPLHARVGLSEGPFREPDHGLGGARA